MAATTICDTRQMLEHQEVSLKMQMIYTVTVRPRNIIVSCHQMHALSRRTSLITLRFITHQSKYFLKEINLLVFVLIVHATVKDYSASIFAHAMIHDMVKLMTALCVMNGP